MVEVPLCYIMWLGNRADTPEAQAAYIAAPFQGDGGIRGGWRSKTNRKCRRCMEAARSPMARRA